MQAHCNAEIAREQRATSRSRSTGSPQTQGMHASTRFDGPVRLLDDQEHDAG
jgi:hypothetical protein